MAISNVKTVSLMDMKFLFGMAVITATANHTPPHSVVEFKLGP